ncbi:DUF3795 domain-containing protein [candidate division WOR-3 bacterium]|nr:DUF3795 domain-containing protein [candidate division WOR-3 bacterium]
MQKMIAICGLVCTDCPAFIATQENDDEKRKKVAEMWSKAFNTDLKPENINCDGCLIEKGKLFGHCKVCEIRKCGLEKNVKNCACCDEYSCEKLNNLLKYMPEAKTTLEEIRRSL